MSGRNPEAVAGHEREQVESDDLLWWSARSGDVEAFVTLFERHAKAIYNYCFRRVGDWSAAEGLLSVVFLEAWRRREKELPPGKVLPWLYGIATNVVRGLRPLLERPVDLVLQAHGAPTDRGALERALS